MGTMRLEYNFRNQWYKNTGKLQSFWITSVNKKEIIISYEQAQKYEKVRLRAKKKDWHSSAIASLPLNFG